MSWTRFAPRQPPCDRRLCRRRLSVGRRLCRRSLAVSLTLAMGLPAPAAEGACQIQGGRRPRERQGGRRPQQARKVSVAQGAADRTQRRAGKTIPPRWAANPRRPGGATNREPCRPPGRRRPPPPGTGKRGHPARRRPRKPVTPAAGWLRRHRPRAPTWTRSKTSSIRFRKHKPDRRDPDRKPRFSDPVAQGSLRSGSSCAATTTTRPSSATRALLITANPSWAFAVLPAAAAGGSAVGRPSRRCAGVGRGSRTKSPLVGQGPLLCSPKRLLARGDRAQTPKRLVARKPGAMIRLSEDTENTALDQFGALLAPGDQKTRMGLLCSTTLENEAARVAGAAQATRPPVTSRWAKRRALASVRESPKRQRPCSRPCRPKLHGDPGYPLRQDPAVCGARRSSPRRPQLMLSAPEKILPRLHNLGRMVDRAAGYWHAR